MADTDQDYVVGGTQGSGPSNASLAADMYAALDNAQPGSVPEQGETDMAAQGAPGASADAAAAASTKEPDSIFDRPEYKQLTREGENIMRDRRAITQRGLAMLQQQNKDLPAPPQLEKGPAAPNNKSIVNDAMQWMQLATVLGAMAGGIGRRNTTAALNAFGSAIKGFVQGKREQFEQGIEEWKAASQKVKDDNQAKIDQYELVLANKKMSADQQMAAIRLLATQSQDEMAYNAAKIHDFETINAQMQKEKDFQARLDRQDIMMNAHLAQIMQSIQSQGYRGVQGKLVADWATEFQQKNGRPPTAQEKIDAYGAIVSGVREQSAIGGRAGNIAIAVQEASENIPQLEAAAKAVGRNGLAVWNSARNQWDVQKGDANYANFVSLLNAFINIYARTGGSAAGTVEQREHAREVLNPNMPMTAFLGALRGMRTEILIAQHAPGQVRQNIQQGTTTNIPEVGTAPSSGGAQIYFDSQGNRVQAPGQ